MSEIMEELGIEGRTHIQKSLTNTKDPLRVIEDFQKSNSIMLPSLDSALNLLGMCFDFYILKVVDI